MTLDAPENIKSLIHEWIQDRHQALREQIMLTWEEGMGRLTPDAGLLEKIQDQMAPPPSLGLASDTETDLGHGLDLIESATSQGEVLKRLLEALQPFAERCALFVIKQGIATLYHSRGFEPAPPRNAPPVVPPSELEPLLQGIGTLIDSPGPAYSALLAPLSRFEASSARILALRLRRKTVAILLVDSGLRQVIDHPSHIRALVHSAESALSVIVSQREEEKTATHIEPPPSAPTQHIPETLADPSTPALDPKIRTNAERSARVLVGDIELYFPAKVTQGRQISNLYGVLKDELDRSRAAFVERYGADTENRHLIFYQTVISQLCENDPSKLGPAPWNPHP